MSVAGVSYEPSWTETSKALCVEAVRKMAQHLRQRRHRRELALLSDDQLHDAGIDLALAGRGRAAAIDADLFRRVQCI